MHRRNTTPVMLLLLHAVMIGALLVLVLLSARLYSAALEARTGHTADRLALSYIQSQTAAFSADQVLLQPGLEGEMLVLREQDGQYETRIYLNDSVLYSEFCAVDAATDPALSQRICNLETLSLNLQDGLLHVNAQGRVGVVCMYGGETHE